MPPSVRYDRTTVLSAAFRLVRKSGLSALNARAVAKEAGSSTQPIFRLYNSMDELKADVCEMAGQQCFRFFHERIQNSSTPLLEYGLSYILFAQDEPELFKILFMCDRSCAKNKPPELTGNNDVIQNIRDMTGYSEEKAVRMLHWLWVFAHGLAVSMATRYLFYTEDKLRFMLISAFDMVKQRMDQYQD